MSKHDAVSPGFVTMLNDSIKELSVGQPGLMRGRSALALYGLRTEEGSAARVPCLEGEALTHASASLGGWALRD